jgi:hypothetical protein
MSACKTKKAKVDSARKSTGKAAPFRENAHRVTWAICSVNKRTKFSLELLATDFHLSPSGFFHPPIRAQQKPLLGAGFFDTSDIPNGSGIPWYFQRCSSAAVRRGSHRDDPSGASIPATDRS